MILYKDFAPEVTRPQTAFKQEQISDFSMAVDDLNNWISRHSYKVISIETLLLPNIYRSSEEGSDDPSLRVSGSDFTRWYQVIRVWYVK